MEVAGMDTACWCSAGRGASHSVSILTAVEQEVVQAGTSAEKLCKPQCNVWRSSWGYLLCTTGTAGLLEDENAAAGQQHQGTMKMWSKFTQSIHQNGL